MKIDELKSIVNKQEEIGLSNLVLKMSKPVGWRPRGWMIRTAFGLCEIYNVTNSLHETSIVFCAKIENIKKYILKYEKQLENLHEKS